MYRLVFSQQLDFTSIIIGDVFISIINNCYFNRYTCLKLLWKHYLNLNMSLNPSLVTILVLEHGTSKLKQNCWKEFRVILDYYNENYFKEKKWLKHQTKKVNWFHKALFWRETNIQKMNLTRFSSLSSIRIY